LVSGLNGAETANEQLSYLMNLAGRPYQPMILWVPRRDVGKWAAGHDDFPGSNLKDNEKDLWLLTYGMIKSVSRGSGVGTEGIPTLEALEVSVEFEAGPYFEPLNHINWRWRSNGRNHAPYTQVVTYTPPDIHPQPPRLSMGEITNPTDLDSGFEQVRFDTSVYGITPFLDPGNWCRAYARSADTFYEIHKAKLPTEDPDDMIATILGGSVGHVVYPDTNTWAAAPRSLYYFSNFSLGGATLAIEVETTTPTGTYTTTASVEVDDINTILNELNYPSISPTDRMIIGGLARTGGYYLRDNGSGVWEILDFFVPWEYGGLYPGETFPGRNEVTISGPSNATYSYAHVYRTM
jgi:hypothetical protein